MSQGTVLTDRFDRALLYATHVHGGQVRKGTSTPYVAYLLAVAATVLEYGGDEDLAIAALLHDSVEDQGGKPRLEDVRNRFGERVARIVEACSDSLADTAKGERKADWKERKKAYIARNAAPTAGARGPCNTGPVLPSASFLLSKRPSPANDGLRYRHRAECMRALVHA
jgi:(p)ppGpp synthase/HD superfamily hydrolase